MTSITSGSKRKADFSTYVDEFNIFSQDSMEELYTRVLKCRTGKFHMCVHCFETYVPTLVDSFSNNETVICKDDDAVCFKDYVSTPVVHCMLCKQVKDNMDDTTKWDVCESSEAEDFMFHF